MNDLNSEIDRVELDDEEAEAAVIDLAGDDDADEDEDDGRV